MAEERSIFGTYVHSEHEFVRGEGVRLFQADGSDHIDFYAGIATSSLGHAHPHLVACLKEQADKLWHLSNLYRIPGQDRLAERLCARSFADKVFFANSGAEALECSFKTARRYHYDRGEPERINILTFEGAFHGRTLATIAAGGQEKYLEGFGPKAPGFISLPFGDEKALDAAVDGETAAILIEPIQGEGGVREVPKEFLSHLRQVCDDNGLLLILDEVQTGIGRTGKLFAYEWAGIEPDLMALAKGLGGGFPVGACLATEAAAAAMVPGTHGTTFGGNPLAMAVANAVMDVVTEDGFLDHVNQMSIELAQHAAELVDTYPDLFEEMRGRGLLRGLKCRVPNTQVAAALRDAGVLVAPAGDNVVRLMPPLVVTSQDLREARQRMDEALARLAGKGGQAKQDEALQPAAKA